jgi:Cell morphogenesis N-terminal
VRVVEDLFRKIKNIPVDVDLDIPVYFGPGADPELDKVLMSLGHIGAHKPTPVINTVMYWRQVKAKPEGAADGASGGRSFTPTPANVPPGAAAAITAGINSNPPTTPAGPSPLQRGQHIGSTPPALIRRQTEPASVIASQGQEVGGQFSTHQLATNQLLERERTNRCAIYILCRALIEVVKHTTAEALTDDIASKIEAIVFQQLVKEDSEDIYRRGSQKSASWHIFAELLGCFSNIRYCFLPALIDGRFSSVSDRFIEFLEKYKNGVIPKEVEGSVETVIRAITYLKIKVINQSVHVNVRYTQWMP